MDTTNCDGRDVEVEEMMALATAIIPGSEQAQYWASGGDVAAIQRLLVVESSSGGIIDANSWRNRS